MRTATVRLPGHPDQLCDLVAEAIVDEYLRRDPDARVRLAVHGGRGALFVSGDILSSADYDVSDLIKRTLGTLGITDEIEIFVSLESVSADRIATARLSSESSVMVTGYATAETPEKLPETVSLARQVAKRLYEKRGLDPEWFWLGPDAEVTVLAEGARPSRIILNIEHGNESLDSVRLRVASEFREVVNGLPISVNMTGACEKRSLTLVSGGSGRGTSVYGSLLPALPALVGLDIQCVEKAGSWLARRAALSLLRRGAVAPLVQAVYLPGDFKPAYIKARDAHGRDLSADIIPAELSLDRVRKEWWRSGLNLDAVRWGFAGEPGLPWEE